MSEIYAGATKMTADVCPNWESCTECRSTHKSARNQSFKTQETCSNKWHDEPAQNPAAPVSATPRTDAFLENEVNSIDNEYLAFMRQLERELAEAKRDADSRYQGMMNWKRQCEAYYPQVNGYNDALKRAESAEARAAELQAKLAAETARADGAHNAAIDKCIAAIPRYGHVDSGDPYDQGFAQCREEYTDAILALKVPQ